MLINNNNEYRVKRTINNIIKFISKIDLTSPVSMLSMNVDYEAYPVGGKDIYDYEKLKKISRHIEDPNPVDINNPRIYIYNSHQLEHYSRSGLEIYNITPNVLMASYILKERFHSLGIPTIVEDTNMAEFMRINNWRHADSYRASRILILDKKSKYDSIEYFIDIHRDSIRRELTTTTINGKKYAQILFVVGLENPNYQENLRLANSLHKKLNEKYPTISKGILRKQGPGVDGVYNQDISPRVMLVEVGGVENVIEEVLNTVEAFALTFVEFMGEYE